MEKELDFDIEDDFPIYNIADYPSDTSNKTTNKTTNEVDEIIEFYRDLEENAKEEEQQQPASSQKIKKKAFLSAIPKKDKIKPKSDIQTEVYGLSTKGRMFVYRLISAVVSLCIITGSLVLSYILPGNEELITQQQEDLRNSKDYQSLKSRYDALKTEVENLKTTNKDKKQQLKKISDFDNSKAELKKQITAKTYELNQLNAQITTKREEIATLDQSIAEKALPQTILPPGKYVVGKNIAAGKYEVTGTGKFMQASAAGKSKVNTTLGSTPLVAVLENNDIIKFDSKVKFTVKN